MEPTILDAIRKYIKSTYEWAAEPDVELMEECLEEARNLFHTRHIMLIQQGRTTALGFKGL